MILVDSSVWIQHFRTGNKALEHLLEEQRVLAHDFVLGEIACGNLKKRDETLGLLDLLPRAPTVEHAEAFELLHAHRLAGCGIGWIDVHLLASTLLSDARLWTFDAKLKRAALKLKVHFEE